MRKETADSTSCKVRFFANLFGCFFPKCFQTHTVQILSSHLGKDSGKDFTTQCSISKNRLKP